MREPFRQLRSSTRGRTHIVPFGQNEKGHAGNWAAAQNGGTDCQALSTADYGM
jgi:hypothetical protein